MITLILENDRGLTVQNLQNENGFGLHENAPVGRTYLHMNGFARRLVYRGKRQLGNAH